MINAGFEEDMRKAREETMSLVSAETDNRKSDKAEILDNVEKVRQGAMDKVADKCKALQDIIGALEAKTAGEKQLFDDEIGSLKNTIKTGLQVPVPSLVIKNTYVSVCVLICIYREMNQTGHNLTDLSLRSGKTNQNF